MNFRDVYKSANSKIEGNRELLDKAFAVQKKEKHYHFVGFCTACVAIVAVLFSVLKYNINFTNTENTPRVLRVAPSGSSSTSKIDKTDAMQNRSIFDLDGKDKISPSEKLRSFPTAAEQETQEQPLADEIPMPSSSEITTNEICTRELSKREYIEYLDAWDIIRNFALPEGFVVNEPYNYTIATDASGNIIDDSINLDAIYMDRFPVKIILGKHNPHQKSDGITKRYGNTDVNIFKIDNEIYVFLIYDNIWVDATFSNITYDDLDMLLIKMFANKNLN